MFKNTDELSLGGAQEQKPRVIMQQQVPAFDPGSDDAAIIRAQSCDTFAFDWRNQVASQSKL